jgi:hypothetical protein
LYTLVVFSETLRYFPEFLKMPIVRSGVISHFYAKIKNLLQVQLHHSDRARNTCRIPVIAIVDVIYFPFADCPWGTFLFRYTKPYLSLYFYGRFFSLCSPEGEPFPSRRNNQKVKCPPIANTISPSFSVSSVYGGIVGRAALLHSFLRADVVDELRIVVIPFRLGGGIALFGTLEQEIPLTLLRPVSIRPGSSSSTMRLVKSGS